MVVTERKGGLIQLRVMAWESDQEHYIQFNDPAYNAYTFSNPEFDTDVLRYGYTSMRTPQSTFDYNMTDRTQELKKQQAVLGGEFSEDNYVDKILEKALGGNISYVKANFPRSFIDVNRSPLELDSLMVSSNIPIIDKFNLTKVKSGIGVIHRVSYYGNEIYDQI